MSDAKIRYVILYNYPFIRLVNQHLNNLKYPINPECQMYEAFELLRYS